MELRVGHVRVLIKEGDITEEDVDAIVNPANSLMVMGGGVAGAIKRKGGDVIEREALRHAPVPVGEAVATTAGRLKARYVIHAPTMERPAMRTTAEKVRRAAEAALLLAARMGLKSVALPAMGAGVGGVPVRDSVKAILSALRDNLDRLSGLQEVRLVAWGRDAYREFVEAAREFGEG